MTTSSPLRKWLVGGWLLTSSACGLLPDFQGPEICRSVAEEEIVGGLPDSDEVVTVERSQTLDLRDQIPEKSGFELELRLERAEFEVLDGTRDLSFIKTANVDVQGSASAQALGLVRYQQSAAVTPSGKLEVASASDQDLLPLVEAGPLTVKATFTAKPPAETTRIGLRLCFSTTGRYVGGAKQAASGNE